jgi:hypothetical protein
MFPLGKVVSVVLVSKDPSRGMTFSMSRVADVEERQNFRDFNRTQRTSRDEPANLGSFGALLRQRLDLPEPAPVTSAEKSAAAGAAPVGTAKVAEVRVLSDGPPAADRNRLDAAPAAAQKSAAQKSDEQASAARQEGLGVVHGRRRPQKPGQS